MKKGSILNSIFRQRCPRCQEGKMFEEQNPYKLMSIFKMHDSCSECGQIYQLEPSFFYGAMYVNYALTVAWTVATFVAMYVIDLGWETMDYVIGMIGVLLLTAPLTFRLGRMIWINIFVKYDSNAKVSKQS